MTHRRRHGVTAPRFGGSAGCNGRTGRWWMLASAMALALAPLPAFALEPRVDREKTKPIATKAWVRFLGWSADGRRIAWRAGPQGQYNTPGQPCDIARLDASGRVVDQVHIAGDVTAALVARRIHSVPLGTHQQVTARDGLVRDRAGHLWAGLVRDNLAAILYKRDKAYLPLWRMALPASALSVDLVGFENPIGDLMALVIEARMGRATAAALLVVPTSMALPEPGTPTEDAQAGATP